MAITSSMRLPGTSMRVGALQDWPEFIITERTPPVTADCEVRVVEDDVGALAAQFLGHALDGRGGVAGHLDAGAGRAGERDHVDLGMAGDRGADGRAVAVDQVEHAGRHAGGMQDLGQT
jgi:hypothetical protein